MLETDGLGSGLYVDVENLGEDAAARNLIQGLLLGWPATIPPLARLCLYVRADKVVLWRAWAQSQVEKIKLEVRGVQHFTAQQSKNSADIAIVLDAIADFIKGHTHHIAVFSDDSDFISLFEKVREEAAQSPVPFTWVLTKRPGNKSPHIDGFFPKEYLHFVDAPAAPVKAQKPVAATKSSETAKSATPKPAAAHTEIAETLIRNLPLGGFGSSDCKKIVKAHHPGHSMGSLSDAQFGSELATKIWPLLMGRGVTLTKAKAPRRYEMTQAAKDSVK